MDKRSIPILGMATTARSPIESSRLCVIAEDVLSEIQGKAAHIDTIVRFAIQNGTAPSNLSEEEFKRKLNAAIAANAKRKKGALFAKVNQKKAGKTVSRKGWYKLKTSPIVEPPEPPIQPTNLYMGKFGEYAVISELLYWGANVSPMIVDRGIDLVAEKNNKYFYIQVKACLESDWEWRFAIKRTSFEANHSNLMYYVFVLRSAKEVRNTFVVIPSMFLDALARNGSIKGVDMGIKISTADKGKTWRLNNAECTMFVNAFNLFS